MSEFSGHDVFPFGFTYNEAPERISRAHRVLINVLDNFHSVLRYLIRSKCGSKALQAVAGKLKWCGYAPLMRKKISACAHCPQPPSVPILSGGLSTHQRISQSKIVVKTFSKKMLRCRTTCVILLAEQGKERWLMAVNNEETLGQIIKSKRLRLGLSLRDLAKQTGLSHSSILRIEENQFKMVDTDTLGAIADALHLDRLYLFSLNGSGVKDEDIRVIARAAGKMNPEQKKQMMAMLRSSFADAFNSSESDDLDNNNGEFLDERV